MTILDDNRILNYRGLYDFLERLKGFFIKNPAQNRITGRYLRCIDENGNVEWAEFPALLTYKGNKASYSQLPASNNSPGDVWHVEDTNAEYVWLLNQAGTSYEWEYMGLIINLTNHAKFSDASLVGKVLVSKSNGSGGITYEWKDAGDVNVIETVKVNDTALIPDANKAVNVTVPVNTLYELTITDDLEYSINISYSNATHNLIYLTDTSEGNTFIINVSTSMTSSTPKEIIYHINTVSSVTLVIQKTSGDSGVLESYTSLTNIGDSVEIVFTFWKNGLVTYNGGEINGN